MPAILCVAAVAAAAVPAMAAADGPWHAEAARYGVSKPVEHMVTMSDGVKLAADVYRPTLPSGAPAPGHFPVILSQTPYGKRSSVTTQSMGQGMGGDGFYPYLVERGYIDVVADVRGTGSSEGDFSLFGPRERQDGVELARWAAALPGSTGRVGLAGSSYVGLNQIFTAALGGPHSPVKAIIPSTVGSNLYRDLAFGGGISNLEFATVWEGLRASMVGSPPEASRVATLADFDARLYTTRFAVGGRSAGQVRKGCRGTPFSCRSGTETGANPSDRPRK